jgi:hypothetical protein
MQQVTDNGRLNKGGGNNLFRFIKISPNQKPGFQSISPRFSSKKGKLKVSLFY